jgi:hypothetical protein
MVEAFDFVFRRLKAVIEKRIETFRYTVGLMGNFLRLVFR